MDKNLIWETDAELIDPSIIERMLYKNEYVVEYLEYRSKHFVVATKGTGKTMLLKSKRYALEKELRSKSGFSDDGGVFFIPSVEPYLDFSIDFKFLSKKVIDFLHDWKNAKTLWLMSLQISILSYHFANKKEDYYSIYAKSDLPSKIKNMMFGGECNPSTIVVELLNMTISDYQNLLRSTGTRLRDMFSRLIRYGVFVFMDRVDQSLMDYRALWVSIQVGLLEAAWDLMRMNAHVKVYCSIRLEAYENYESPNKHSISGEVSVIKYDIADLKEMLNALIYFYEGKESLQDFVKLGMIKNPITHEREDVFEYIYRHTLMRPRDFVYISSCISPEAKALTVEKFRGIINKASDLGIARKIFSENVVFMECLHDKQQREVFLSFISKNIINFDEMVGVCSEFNGVECCDGSKCGDCNLNHPFCELYNAGLLGVASVVEWLQNDDEPAQLFLDAYQMSCCSQHSLPTTKAIYFIHPSLNHYIQESRLKNRKNDYYIFDHITIGHGKPWSNKHQVVYHIQELLLQMTDVECRKKIQNIIKSMSKDDLEKIDKDICMNKVNTYDSVVIEKIFAQLKELKLF